MGIYNHTILKSNRKTLFSRLDTLLLQLLANNKAMAEHVAAMQAIVDRREAKVSSVVHFQPGVKDMERKKLPFTEFLY